MYALCESGTVNIAPRFCVKDYECYRYIYIYVFHSYLLNLFTFVFHIVTNISHCALHKFSFSFISSEPFYFCF